MRAGRHSSRWRFLQSKRVLLAVLLLLLAGCPETPPSEESPSQPSVEEPAVPPVTKPEPAAEPAQADASPASNEQASEVQAGQQSASDKPAESPARSPAPESAGTEPSAKSRGPRSASQEQPSSRSFAAAPQKSQGQAAADLKQAQHLFRQAESRRAGGNASAAFAETRRAWNLLQGNPDPASEAFAQTVRGHLDLLAKEISTEAGRRTVPEERILILK